MHKLEVGKVYPGKISIEQGTLLDYNEGGFTLYYFLPNITSAEQEGFQKGNYKFALAERSGILFFLSEFKRGIDLSDTPFHFGLYDDDRIKHMPKHIDKGQGLALTIIAVDSRDQILKAIRVIGLPTKFSKELIDICVRQSQEKVDRSEYNSKIMDVQRNYQAKDLLRFSTIQCKG